MICTYRYLSKSPYFLKRILPTLFSQLVATLLQHPTSHQITSPPQVNRASGCLFRGATAVRVDVEKNLCRRWGLVIRQSSASFVATISSLV